MSDTTQTNDSNTLNALDCISRKRAVSAISDLLMLELKGKRLPTWNEVYRAINAVPSVQSDIVEKILAAGMEGKEVRFYIGGRLFAVRELPQ